MNYEIPSFSYQRIVATFVRLGFCYECERAGQVWLVRDLVSGDPEYLPIPQHNPVMRSTLGLILQRTNIELTDFLRALDSVSSDKT